jgi:hypothetical protein
VADASRGDVGDTPWHHSLMTRGHDPLKR